jgi:hypothetical protein
MTRAFARVALLATLLGAPAWPAEAKVVVFQEPGFPAVESEAPARETLAQALGGLEVSFAGVDALREKATLAGADLLVLPYGSSFPAEAWPALRDYFESGGNLLALGGRPLFVPVTRVEGRFRVGEPTSEYWRLFAAVDSVTVASRADARFAWDGRFAFAPHEIRARRTFAMSTVYVNDYVGADLRWRGLGFFQDAHGTRVAAPVTRLDFTLRPKGPAPEGRGRLVLLSFEPEPGYWESEAGRALVREMAVHAARGPAFVWVELPLAAVHEGEGATSVVHLQDSRPAADGRLRVELLSGARVLETRDVPCPAGAVDADLTWAAATSPGLYGVRATYERGGGIVDVHETGFWRRDPALLASGAALSAGATYLRRDGRPFLVVGVNHWLNDEIWASFPENANALEWDRDFAEMAAGGLSFIRTGIWSGRLGLISPPTGTARESVLRNIEAFLLTAGRHGLQVQFTLFAFDPQTMMRAPGGPLLGPGRNPYTDPVAIASQQAFVRSIAARFATVPFLSFDLVNEPSFSNPRNYWHGNQPNGDPTEVAAWNDWLRARYGKLDALAEAWGTLPGELTDFGAVPLPEPRDLAHARTGNAKEVRAVDYNLFAQDAFRAWTREMVRSIRATGSRQLVGVGQDEGGVGDRLLNQFYGADVDLTSMHNWWNDDALLWDALAAKRPDRPNLVGETGPQPAIGLDGRSRWDEVRGLGLFERKLVLGLAAGNAGALPWIWSRYDTFHIGRNDGSTTPWQQVLTGVAAFAQQAAPSLGEARPGEVAIVLPHSLQLSVFGGYAREAQQKCLRALYHYAHGAGSVVGEYQIEQLGHPRLILLPSPWVLSERAWRGILERVNEGATLLVSGRFDLDEHFRPTGRAHAIGLDYAPGILAARENPLRWPGGVGRAVFSGDKTTQLEQARLAGEATFARRAYGRGQVLFFTLPLELGDDLALVGRVYAWALAQAKVAPLYRTTLDDPGILICPFPLETGTLYAFSSESSLAQDVALRDAASGADLRVHLEPGRAALVLVARDGRVVARYTPVPSAAR